MTSWDRLQYLFLELICKKASAHRFRCSKRIRCDPFFMRFAASCFNYARILWMRCFTICFPSSPHPFLADKVAILYGEDRTSVYLSLMSHFFTLVWKDTEKRSPSFWFTITGYPNRSSNHFAALFAFFHTEIAWSGLRRKDEHLLLFVYQDNCCMYRTMDPNNAYQFNVGGIGGTTDEGVV